MIRIFVTSDKRNNNIFEENYYLQSDIKKKERKGKRNDKKK